MSEQEQIEAFCDELDKLVKRFETEFDMSRAAAVGSLNFKAFSIMQAAFDDYHDIEEVDD